MATYRLFIRNHLGKIGESRLVDAHSDNEAIRRVKAKNIPSVCEIWDRDRHVADVPAFEANQ